MAALQRLSEKAAKRATYTQWNALKATPHTSEKRHKKKTKHSGRTSQVSKQNKEFRRFLFSLAFHVQVTSTHWFKIYSQPNEVIVHQLTCIYSCIRVISIADSFHRLFMCVCRFVLNLAECRIQFNKNTLWNMMGNVWRIDVMWWKFIFPSNALSRRDGFLFGCCCCFLFGMMKLEFASDIRTS